MKIRKRKNKSFHKNIAIIMTAVISSTSLGLNTITNAVERKKDCIETKAINKSVSEFVDLENQFNLSGVRSDYEGTNYTSLDHSYFSVDGNTLRIGKYDTTNIRQSIALTSRYKVDFKRNFEINGEINLSSLPDGFAIGFHTNGNYTNRNAGGSLGVYSEPGYYHAESRGIPNGIVIEVDTFNNAGDPNIIRRPFGDDAENYPGTVNGKHIAVNYTDDNGKVVGTLNKYNISNIFDQYQNFKLSWNVETNIIEFTIGRESIRAEVGNKAELLKQSNVYYTIGTVLALKEGRYNDKNIIKLNNFKYTDVEPSIKTIDIKSVKDGYAIPEEKITVTHEIKNNKQSVAEITDVLTLEKMKVDNSGNDLQISNVKAGTDLSRLEPKTFDKNNPLQVKYMPNKASYYVQYDVTIPNLKNYGNTNQLNYQVLLGEQGMTQISLEGSFEIRNKPSLKKGEKEIYDVVHVTNSETTKDKLWSNLKAKTAKGSENRLVTEQTSAGDVNVDWNYYEDFSRVNNLPSEIEKGKVYSVYVIVTDKNDTRLSNKIQVYAVVSDNMETDGEYYVFGNDSQPILETKLSTLTDQQFKEYVKETTKAKAFKITKSNGNCYMKDADVSTEGWLDSAREPYKVPGDHQIDAYVKERDSVKVSLKQKVTENTWSYEEDKLPTDNGASGFIVIPKAVNMESGTGNDENKIVGKGKIYFADYSAKDAKYNISVDKTFDISNTKDRQNKVSVITSDPENIAVNNGEKIKFQNIGKGYSKENPLEIDFKASRTKIDKEKGRWDGKVTFYFERVS